ncbi:MAG: aldehyde dehydrogenase [Streptosporangiaceae bacterium]|jgi:acyl-CoA reductase-like NAD-dependent aldehyde dehydrogenase|nr:aldehyde dehydrogenase [Streptosporangiaceae bacterium]
MSEPLLHWIDGESVASCDGTTHTFTNPFKIAAEEGVRAEIGGTLAHDPALMGDFYVEPTVYTDVDEVVAGAAAGAFATQGESCIAGFRLYAQRGVFDEVVRRMADYAASIKLGRGSDPATQMGPLISAEHRDKVLGYVAIGIAEGAKVVTGGHAVAGEGYFAEPTVLVNAKPDSHIMHEEIFGPVVCAVPFDTEDEVLALANNTRFGLGAAVWTRDISRAHRMAAAIESGQVWVNCYQAADSALPFGGTKESGWGRETCRETLEEYLETKTVVVSL